MENIVRIISIQKETADNPLDDNPRVLVDRLYNEMVLWRCPIPIMWL